MQPEPNEPPRPLRQTAPDTLELRQGGGCMAAFGLPFFLAGLGLALGLADVIHIGNRPSGIASLAALGVMSLAFLLVGGTLTFGRQWQTFDRSRGVLIRQLGLLVPMHRTERLLTDFQDVVIDFVRGDSETPNRYPVSLRAVRGKNATILQPERFEAAHQAAEQLSGFLHLPLTDATTDHRVVLTPEHAADSLRQRLSAEGTPSGPVSPPATMSGRVTESGGTVTIRLPGRGLFGKAVTVQATAAGLVVERAGLGGKTTRLAADDILDVDYGTFNSALESVKSSPEWRVAPDSRTERFLDRLSRWVPSPGITVKSRRGLITFGAGLPEDELRYLHSVLRSALARR
jgi:hypothetical protein